MLPRHWLAAQDARAAYAGTLDAVNTLDDWKSLKQIENAFPSPSVHTLFEQQRTIEDLARQYRAPVFDFGANSALAKLTLAGVSAELASVASRVHAAELHSHLFEATKVLDYASKWRDIQGAITAAGAGLTSWDHIRRISDTLGLETSLVRHLARISDLGTGLRGLMPEPAHVAWATHLRMTALPTVSFLGQEWSKPVGLLTGLGSELGASIAWLTRHRAEPVVMTAAITPQAERKAHLKVVVEDEILCVLCENPVILIRSNLTWIGPRRAVRQRRVFPLCATCSATEAEHPGFLYDALCELTRPAISIRGVIRGGSRGDGQPRGVLRLIRIDGEDGKP
jgi:hypothetical protein